MQVNQYISLYPLNFVIYSTKRSYYEIAQLMQSGFNFEFSNCLTELLAHESYTNLHFVRSLSNNISGKWEQMQGVFTFSHLEVKSYSSNQ